MNDLIANALGGARGPNAPPWPAELAERYVSAMISNDVKMLRSVLATTPLNPDMLNAVTLPGVKGTTTLLVAAQRQVAACLCLLEDGRFTNVNHVDPKTGKTALHIAAKNGYEHLCKKLIHHPNFVLNADEDKYGKTALDHARATFRTTDWWPREAIRAIEMIVELRLSITLDESDRRWRDPEDILRKRREQSQAGGGGGSSGGGEGSLHTTTVNNPISAVVCTPPALLPQVRLASGPQ